MQNRRTERTKIVALAALLGATLLLLASCNSGGVGIFYGLEHETKVTNNSNLSDKLPVGSMLSMTIGSQPVYYIGADKVYEATHKSPPAAGAALSWNAVKAPDTTHVLSTQVATDDSKLYAVYSSTDGTSAEVYETTPSVSALNKPSWSAVSGYSGATASTPAYTVQSIFVLNKKLFVSVLFTSGTEAGLYGLFQGGDTSSALVDGSGNPVYTSSLPVGGAYDSGTYWVGVGNQLYSGTSPTNLTAVASSAQPSLGIGETFTGIYYSSALNTLFVSTSTGQLFAEKSGGSFGSAASWPSGITATSLDGFGEFATTDSNGNAREVVLVGSSAGYYELDIDPASFNVSSLSLLQPGNTGTLSASVNYLSIALKQAHVVGFFGDANRFFALTGGAGLWRSEASTANPPRTWTLE